MLIPIYSQTIFPDFFQEKLELLPKSTDLALKEYVLCPNAAEQLVKLS